MTLIDTNGLTRVGYEPIDLDHHEFADLLNHLATADNATFPSLFQQLFEHTERHFEFENQLMERYGFPAITEHKGEHLRVLAEFKQFKKRVDKGLLTFGRSFIRDHLLNWFILHASTMDSALAAHIKLQR